MTTERLSAFNEIKTVVAELRASKLHDAEADTILWAAESSLLDGDDIGQATTAFTTLMGDLAQHRWAEHGKTADRLAELMAATAGTPAVAHAS